jgi:hypothetical protein
LEYVESFSHELEDETAVKDDFREYWLGSGTDELMDQLVEGKPDAWRYFHFQKLSQRLMAFIISKNMKTGFCRKYACSECSVGETRVRAEYQRYGRRK